VTPPDIPKDDLEKYDANKDYAVNYYNMSRRDNFA
jgi:hypothetical protein